jgi:negative regulator of flagellin synthesis FlgM
MEISSLLTGIQSYREKADSSETGARRASKNETSSMTGQDRVSLSPEARRAASQVVDATARQRQRKVNEIKERVESGTYEVDSKAIAQKLIQQDPEFFLAGIVAASEETES